MFERLHDRLHLRNRSAYAIRSTQPRLLTVLIGHTKGGIITRLLEMIDDRDHKISYLFETAMAAVEREAHPSYIVSNPDPELLLRAERAEQRANQAEGDLARAREDMERFWGDTLYTEGVIEIARERKRVVAEEGRSQMSDIMYRNSELILMAMSYLAYSTGYNNNGVEFWPFYPESPFVPKVDHGNDIAANTTNHIANMARAGQLIAAEIDRAKFVLASAGAEG